MKRRLLVICLAAVISATSIPQTALTLMAAEVETAETEITIDAEETEETTEDTQELSGIAVSSIVSESDAIYEDVDYQITTKFKNVFDEFESVQSEEETNQVTSAESASKQELNKSNLFLLTASNSTPAAKALPALTGNQRSDAVNIANSQIGYVEGNGNLNIYGKEVGSNGLAWCAYFVVWCLKQAGVDECPTSGSTTANITWFQNKGLWHNKQAVSWSYNGNSCNGAVDSSYMPQAGDYVAIENDGSASNGPDHTGFVVAVDDSWVYTVEGNVEESVVARKYSKSNWRLNGSSSSIYISGLGSINYKTGNSLPYGSLDDVVGGNGTVRVRGWAFDRDALNTATKIHIYIGNEEGWEIVANTERTDVNDAYPGVGNNHGFDHVIKVGVRGTYNIKIYAVDIQDSSQKTLLGNKTVTINTIPFSITYDSNNINIAAEESKTISFTFSGDGIYTMNGSVGNSSMLSHVSWGDIDWSEGTGSLVVKGLKAGTTTFTVNLLDENYETLYSKTLHVTITQPVRGISLNKNNTNLNVGETETLTVTVSPDNATNKNVIWTSSNTSVATVTNGIVKAVAPGTATITVTTVDGNKTATCIVMVKAKTISVSSAALNKASASLTVGDTETLTATISPSNATNKNVNWTSSDTSVAIVNNGTVTAVAPGTATITVTTADGNKTATCIITIKAKTISVSSVALNKASASLTVGDTETLTVTISPSNATNKNVKWTSSNTSVATVNNGVVTATAPGTAIITVTSADGNKTATCVVTVEAVANPNAPKLVVSNEKGIVGDTVTVTVDLENNPGFAGLNACLTYSDSLTLLEATNSTSLTFTSDTTMLWDGASDYELDGELLKLVFKVSDDAEIGKHFVKVQFIEAYTAELDDVAFITVDGYVEVIDFTYGDANGDNEINTKDVILIRRHVAAKNPITGESTVEVKTGADANGDGVVNTKDVILARRYVAGKNPVTGESSIVVGPNK